MLRLARSARLANLRSRTAVPTNAFVSSSCRPFWSSSSSSSVETAADLASSSIPSVDPLLLPLLFGVVLSNAVTSEDDEEEAALHSPPWIVKTSSAGEGVGAFASRDIAMGEMLIAERPLAVWPSRLDEAQAKELFERMNARQQKVFMALTDGGAEVRGQLDEIRVRRACNAFSLPVPGVSGVGAETSMSFVFSKIARVNHSWCVPRPLFSSPRRMTECSFYQRTKRNTSHECTLFLCFPLPPSSPLKVIRTRLPSYTFRFSQWNTLRLELFAISPIPSSTEVTIEYLPGLIVHTHSERQFALKTSFGFSRCLCKVCTAPLEERKASDARRREIKYLSGGLQGGVRDRKKTMETMGKIHRLCQEEGVHGLPDFGEFSSLFSTLPPRTHPFPHIFQAMLASTPPTPSSVLFKLALRQHPSSLRSRSRSARRFRIGENRRLLFILSGPRFFAPTRLVEAHSLPLFALQSPSAPPEKRSCHKSSPLFFSFPTSPSFSSRPPHQHLCTATASCFSSVQSAHRPMQALHPRLGFRCGIRME